MNNCRKIKLRNFPLEAKFLLKILSLNNTLKGIEKIPQMTIKQNSNGKSISPYNQVLVQVILLPELLVWLTS